MKDFSRPFWHWLDRLRQWHDARTLAPSHALGRRAEDIAHRFLEKHGYVVIGRNWRSRTGLYEIDILAWDVSQGDPARLVVAEVKSRQRDDFGSPERNLDRTKIRAMRAAASEICHKKFLQPEIIRFDTISIVFEPELKIEHQPDAFSWITGTS